MVQKASPLKQNRNRLALEKSPYLLKHAGNPVDWYPWGEEALKKSKNDNKPIFLSIGYSTCHWCTVMERESFEDEATATLMNRSFISIKVDREERPEIDAYYMKAVQAMTGGGGWPLSVFLTPGLEPFYGGTYFPPEPRSGMPSFKQVLEFVAKVWKDKREEIATNARQVADSISAEFSSPKAQGLSSKLLEDAYSSLASSFDPEHGGFGGSPKFPLPISWAYLLRYHFRTGKEMAIRCVTKTLDEMMAGGIRDHVGGGFHRYSTDRVWLIPHFEKMLYDNALLARLYTEAFQATRKQDYAVVARETLNWMIDEMQDGSGGFYSAQDADTEEGEGVYYTWTPAEVQDVLGESEGAEFCRNFGVTNNGNFDGRSILHTSVTLDSTLDQEKVAGWKTELYKERKLRPRPTTDTKVLTSWNGLAISALAFAGTVLENVEFREAAERAAKFVLEKNAKDGTLLRRFAGGESALEGTLEDYAFLVQGLIDLFEATAEPKWLAEALRLNLVMAKTLEDKDQGGFFLTADSQPFKLKEGYDGVTPSGNSVAASNLVRLSELTGNAELRGMGEKVLTSFGKDIEQQPSGHTNMLVVLDMLRNGMTEVIITSKDPAGALDLTKEVWRGFLPNKAVLLADSENYARLSTMSNLLDGRMPTAKPRAYVCQNFTCGLPADSAKSLKAQLAARLS